MKSQAFYTVWCYISGEAEGEIWNWSLLGVKGLEGWLLSSQTVVSTVRKRAHAGAYSVSFRLGNARTTAMDMQTPPCWWVSCAGSVSMPVCLFDNATWWYVRATTQVRVCLIYTNSRPILHHMANIGPIMCEFLNIWRLWLREQSTTESSLKYLFWGYFPHGKHKIAYKIIEEVNVTKVYWRFLASASFSWKIFFPHLPPCAADQWALFF